MTADGRFPSNAWFLVARPAGTPHDEMWGDSLSRPSGTGFVFKVHVGDSASVALMLNDLRPHAAEDGYVLDRWGNAGKANGCPTEAIDEYLAWWADRMGVNS